MTSSLILAGKPVSINYSNIGLTCHSSSIVSSGNDKHVRVWERIPDEETYDKRHTCKELLLGWPSTKLLSGSFNHIPHDLAFKPGESILAVAERCGLWYRDCIFRLITVCSRKIFLYSGLRQDATAISLSLFGRRADHSVGAMAWGRDSTAVYLFASSEPTRDANFNGFHKGFDVEMQKVAFDFDASEAGDAIGITQDGQWSSMMLAVLFLNLDYPLRYIVGPLY